MNFEDVIELRMPVDGMALNRLEPTWHKYHAEKNIDRYACSITSSDGNDNEGVNFASLYSYNQANGTNFNEMSFKTPTQHARPFSHLLNNFDVGRSHYLKISKAGYFPWHRDADPTSFRIIYTISGCASNNLVWILDDKVLKLEDKRWYYINTTKKHCLFAFDTTMLAVFNLATTQDNYIKLYNHMVIQ